MDSHAFLRNKAALYMTGLGVTDAFAKQTGLKPFKIVRTVMDIL